MFPMGLIVRELMDAMRIWQKSCNRQSQNTQLFMLNWTFMFLILSFIVGMFGFSSLAGAVAGVAQVLFVIFVILLIISGISGGIGRKSP